MTTPFHSTATIARMAARSVAAMPYTAQVLRGTQVRAPSGGGYTTTWVVVGSYACRLRPGGDPKEMVDQGELNEVRLFTVALPAGTAVAAPDRLVITHTIVGLASPITLEVLGVVVRSVEIERQVRAQRVGPVAIASGTQAAASVTVAPPTQVLAVNGTVRLTATAKDKTGAVIPGAFVAWTSANTSLCTVDQSGLVTCVALGEVEIVATCPGSASGYAIVNPINAVTAATMTPNPASVIAGQTVTVTVHAFSSSGAELTNRSVTSVSSSDATKATVSPTSGPTPLAVTVTGVAPGTAVLSAVVETVSAPTDTVTVANPDDIAVLLQTLGRVASDFRVFLDCRRGVTQTAQLVSQWAQAFTGTTVSGTLTAAGTAQPTLNNATGSIDFDGVDDVLSGLSVPIGDAGMALIYGGAVLGSGGPACALDQNDAHGMAVHNASAYFYPGADFVSSTAAAGVLRMVVASTNGGTTGYVQTPNKAQQSGTLTSAVGSASVPLNVGARLPSSVFTQTSARFVIVPNWAPSAADVTAFRDWAVTYHSIVLA